MRTLFLSTTVPYPPTSGANQRIFHLLRALSRISKVTFVCPTEGGHWTSDLNVIRTLFADAVLFPYESFDAYQLGRPSGFFSRLTRAARYHGHLWEPALIRWYRSAAGSRTLADLCRTSFDLIWIERLISVGLVPPRVTSRVIVDLDDVQYRKLAHRLRKTALRPRSVLDMFECLKLRHFERSLVRGSYEYVVCSMLDQQALGGSSRISVIPNGVEIPPQPSWKATPGRLPQLVLVGAMSTEANADAAKFFVNQIFPLVRRAAPEATLMIVGSNPPLSIRQLADGRSITVTGTVPSVVPFLREAAINVVPIRFGGGTRIKILESLAHGLPVVSTHVGAEGLDVESGRHLILADSPADFGAACVRLLQDPARCTALSRAGRELVRQRYNWDIIERKVQHLVQSGTSPTIPAHGEPA